jgi:hypothetical protein
LVFADVWLGLTVFNAIFRSGGTGGLFWAGVVVIIGLLAGRSADYTQSMRLTLRCMIWQRTISETCRRADVITGT